MVRRLILLAVLALGLAACGGSGTPKNAVKIKFGRVSGLITPYTITIAPDGTVSAEGYPPVEPPKSLTSAEVETLSAQVRNEMGKLTTLQCAHTLPDAASSFITALGKTVTVRGDCEPRFTALYDALTTALHLNE